MPHELSPADEESIRKFMVAVVELVGRSARISSYKGRPVRHPSEAAVRHAARKTAQRVLTPEVRQALLEEVLRRTAARRIPTDAKPAPETAGPEPAITPAGSGSAIGGITKAPDIDRPTVTAPPSLTEAFEVTRAPVVTTPAANIDQPAPKRPVPRPPTTKLVFATLPTATTPDLDAAPAAPETEQSTEPGAERPRLATKSLDEDGTIRFGAPLPADAVVGRLFQISRDDYLATAAPSANIQSGSRSYVRMGILQLSSAAYDLACLAVLDDPEAWLAADSEIDDSPSARKRARNDIAVSKLGVDLRRICEDTTPAITAAEMAESAIDPPTL